MRVSISVPDNPHKDTTVLLKEFLDIIPDSHAGSTDEEPEISIKIVEDVGPQWIVFKNSQLQIVLKIIQYKSRDFLRVSKPISKDHPPQLIVNNFTTDIGMKIVEFLASMFPFSQGSRQVANFTVQGDFIYFRLYKYCFGEKSPIMENVGPHLTLRLWRMIEYNGNEKKVMNFKKFIKNSNLL
ncbi:brix domain-containing protein [Encephalitozoon hellem ATCC 50504]|uniref:Ribosome biogenesis protein BRX1 n=1 Tax=Encephalitozoon hellem TaxID=27973 RepID=A0A9Q9FAN7_ENCHE|nr:brix domain-containing protein [Encephalitozoon hellem ATCC 50504]AFM99456.1 brix domain-containing protein [Encephalitozoon hellem ATCC 50504]UTX44467.1 ribosome biogenesis protein BRX1 [Encephalitozoon hellem]|eukprot:XP_003888437.1 brix domain-containing protein [Encephalitozoon hellem ATCC 50504]